MADARVLYSSQEGSILYGRGLFLYSRCPWRPGVPSLLRHTVHSRIMCTLLYIFSQNFYEKNVFKKISAINMESYSLKSLIEFKLYLCSRNTILIKTTNQYKFVCKTKYCTSWVLPGTNSQ